MPVLQCCHPGRSGTLLDHVKHLSLPISQTTSPQSPQVQKQTTDSKQKKGEVIPGIYLNLCFVHLRHLLRPPLGPCKISTWIQPIFRVCIHYDQMVSSFIYSHCVVCVFWSRQLPNPIYKHVKQLTAGLTHLQCWVAREFSTHPMALCTLKSAKYDHISVYSFHRGGNSLTSDVKIAILTKVVDYIRWRSYNYCFDKRRPKHPLQSLSMC